MPIFEKEWFPSEISSLETLAKSIMPGCTILAEENNLRIEWRNEILLLPHQFNHLSNVPNIINNFRDSILLQRGE